MLRAELKKFAKTFDWYYEYSDDSTVWKRGRQNHSKLIGMINQTKFPFSKVLLRQYSHGMYIGNFEEDPIGSGDYYAKDSIRCSPCDKDCLLSEEQFKDIESWFDEELVEDIIK